MVGDDRVFGKGAQKHQLREVALANPDAALAVESHRFRSVRKIGLAQDRQIAVAVEAVAAMRVP